MYYCNYIDNNSKDPNMILHINYHNNLYGFPIEDDNELFGRLILEINQAGLTWLTILKKADDFRIAYDNFNIDKIANYNDRDIDKLLDNKDIIRNRLKINAVIYNANIILKIKKEYKSFKNWLDINHPKTLEEWTKLFKNNFKFTGGEIVKEFLVSTSYLEGAHSKNCPIYEKVIKRKPVWNTKYK